MVVTRFLSCKDLPQYAAFYLKMFVCHLGLPWHTKSTFVIGFRADPQPVRQSGLPRGMYMTMPNSSRSSSSSSSGVATSLSVT